MQDYLLQRCALRYTTTYLDETRLVFFSFIFMVICLGSTVGGAVPPALSQPGFSCDVFEISTSLAMGLLSS
jgi:hypothetical protein